MEYDMKNHLMFKCLFWLMLVISFSGCDKKDDLNPVSPGTNTGNSNPSGQPIPTIPGVNGVLATIQFGYTISGFGTIDYAMGFAQFGTTSGVDAGAVSVNNNNINKMTSGSSVYYSSFSQSNPQTLQNVNFNGSNHTWSVAGGNGVPQFQASVSSPSDFNIISPATNSTISNQNALQVQWSTGSSGSQDSVIVLLTSASSQQTTPYISSIVGNTGSYTIPSNSVKTFSGSVILHVVKFRYNVHNASSKYYALISEIVRFVNLTLQ